MGRRNTAFWSRRHLVVGLALSCAGPPVPLRAAEGVDPLAPFRWRYRPVLVFGSPATREAVGAQDTLLRENAAGLWDRDIVVMRINDGPVTLQDETGREVRHGLQPDRLRAWFRVAPGQFAVILIGKDGGEKFRSQEPVAAEDLFALIDRMPMRRNEMRRQDDRRRGR
ncbi:MAG: DUF4174 domain-containing protein [Alphaproteobacteria bacterium]